MVVLQVSQQLGDGSQHGLQATGLLLVLPGWKTASCLPAMGVPGSPCQLEACLSCRLPAAGMRYLHVAHKAQLTS